MQYNLKQYGLNEWFTQEAALYEGLDLARVTEQHREIYRVVSERGELSARVSGKFAFEAAGSADFPAVGDWVMVAAGEDSAVIHHLLRRKSVFGRRAAGTSGEAQIVAANIDVVFICMSLNADFNLRRLERYLSVAWDSMATPVVVLTKADLCPDIPQKLSDLAAVSAGCDVIVCSGLAENGCADVSCYLSEGKTVAFIGSSGVGKSTLINQLMGRAVLATNTVRADDDKGRHTTTHRQLLLLPQGGVVIDTPGMRELQIESGDLSKSFSDIEALAAQCRYRDCSHTSEPGCAVQAAVQDGTLDRARLENYRKLQRETGYQGLNSRQLEQEKIKRMFGGKGEMKQIMREAKQKNRMRNQ